MKNKKAYDLRTEEEAERFMTELELRGFPFVGSYVVLDEKILSSFVYAPNSPPLFIVSADNCWEEDRVRKTRKALTVAAEEFELD